MKYPDYISNSQLSAFRKSPAHWIQYITEKKEATPAMIMGSLCHCLALEPENIHDKFLVVNGEKPDSARDYRASTNRDWKAEWERRAIQAGRPLIMPEMRQRAEKAVNALLNDSEARKFLEGKREAVLEWMSLGLKFKGIRDISGDSFIADLKFTSSADPNDFRRYLFKEGIYRQGGMYLDGEMGGEFTGEPHKQVYFIAVETDEPYGVSVNELDYEVINFGVNEYRMLAGGLKACMDANHFPSYSYRNVDGIFTVTLPNFVVTE